MPNEVSYVLTLRDGFNPVIERANANTNRLEASLGSLQGGLGGLGATIATAFSVTAIVAFGAQVIKAGTTVENARTGLTTLLKDGNEAGRVISNTMEDAKRTPFEFKGLLAANKALISADESADGARETVLNLANAIAATGGGDDELQRMIVNLQQIKNVGHASALDIKQFAYAGINLYKVLGDAGIKVQKGAENQKISYEQISLALKKAHQEGGIYAMGLENMAHNTSVQISNLGDSVFQLSVKIFDQMKPAIDWVVAGLAKTIELITQFGSWMVSGSAGAEAFGVAISILGGALVTYAIIQGSVSLWTTIVTAATWAWNAALAANPIGLVIAAIGALVAGVIYAYNHFQKFRATLWAVWAVIKEFASIVGDVFGALWKVIHGTFTLNPKEVGEGLMQGIDAVSGSARRLGEAAKAGWDAGMKDFATDEKSKSKGLVPTGKKTPTKVAGVQAAPEAKTKATGSKNVVINVAIKNLIGEYNSNITNIKEMSSDVRQQVVAALTSAVNDFQIVAGD